MGIPCHRVVFKDGSLAGSFAFGGPDVQRRMLEAEGVLFDAQGRVDMSLCAWDGIPEGEERMIGIIAAIKPEIEALKAVITDKYVRTVSSVEYISGKLNGREVVVAGCGAGKVNAAVCTQTMILEYMPDVIINTGVGGTLTDELSIGDVAVATKLVQHDFDTTGCGDPRGYIGVGREYMIEMPCTERLVSAIEKAAEEEGLKTVRGMIASGDTFVSSEAAKSAILENFPGCVACEMEGAAIAQVCLLNNVDFCVVRAISDSADNSAHMDYPSFIKIAAARSAAVTGRVVAAL